MIQDPVLVNEWHVVARSSDLSIGKVIRARLLGEDIVLWRSIDGSVMAWQDLCIHRGARLSLGWVKGDRLICPYHGWEYDANGICIRIPAHPDQKPPAKARVKTYRAIEKYGYIWVSLGNPVKDVPHFAEWYDKSFRKIYCGPYRIRSSGPRAIENFLDVAHFPFVHTGILGDPSKPEIPDYEVLRTEEGIVAKNIRVWQPNPDGTGVGKWETYTYKVLRPLTGFRFHWA
jgi:phenylpropionate dioxygenase-like ring-hydroxylating dioxygenase large terminal subunit